MTIGPGCALWSRRLPAPGRLDALVLGPTGLDHYERLLDRPDRPWRRRATVSAMATGPGRLVRHGRSLLALVPEGDRVVEYLLSSGRWVPAGVVAAAGPAQAEASDPALPWADQPRPRTVARVEGSPFALVDEEGSVFSYRRGADGTWERDSCLRLVDPEPFVASPQESGKLAQVTGDLDATPTPWGQRAATLSRSLTAAGIRGTDLGVRVDHGGRTFLLFGDTHWTRPWLATRDAIAEVVDPSDTRPAVQFHGAPVKLVGHAAGRVTMREYDVPLDGFSEGGHLHVFFSSNHFRGGRVMGRSVLARAVDADPVVDGGARRRPVRFEVLGTFSARHFINVSVQRRPASAVPGWSGHGDVLLVWGTGPYRASEVRLAAVEPAAPLRPRYWAGDGWSESEADARPLFRPAALGELSVRWSEEAGRYLMLTASAPEEDIGNAVVLRAAGEPWGPWSPRIRLLDWVVTGMSLDPHTRFIRATRDDEHVGDRIFRAQASGTGAAYAPYLFDTAVDGDDLVLRYTLSTWNPYQVVLMRHRLPLALLA
ncbi:MAG: DUF4185 domain-containing protein [Propionicimonas sp.]|uniref:DUF4185 domain-containing protein n=1 Tax=Propionicimonas sp. TaxID=1955623 RepID=UPI003D116631